MKCTEATIESVQGKTEVRILQPHCYYFAVLGCDSAVLGLSACHFCPDSNPTVSNSDVLLPVSSLTHSLFHARTSATMSGRQTRSKTKYDQPAAAAPKAASTSKRKPDSSGKGDKPAKKKTRCRNGCHGLKNSHREERHRRKAEAKLYVDCHSVWNTLTAWNACSDTTAECGTIGHTARQR